MAQQVETDVAIIGGGPAGSTVGTLLKKYRPDIRVSIFEREVFPRDHVGESLLPPINNILEEMGCWDKVERANFPVKLGATYRWGKFPELWDLDFIPPGLYKDSPRPGSFTGHRRLTAFQVDRSIYDKILLDHASDLGVSVREDAKVSKVHHSGGLIEALEIEDGTRVVAKHYVDASGNSGTLRRALNIQTEHPTSLQNIAIWAYWRNTDWAIQIGVGGTRIQVLSLPYGWIWFIPLGPDRTSIGLVIPASYYKNSGKRPEQLYAQALSDEQRVAKLIRNAEREESPLQSTKDWSFLASSHTGKNWFLVGESAGFADPILSAGLSLTHSSARELAYTLAELDRGENDADWLKSQFESRQMQRTRNHIRFADFWYCANSQFKELKEFTAQLARESGLELSPEKAWDWIGKGGFVQESGRIGAGDFSLSQVKTLGEFLSEVQSSATLNRFNRFELNLEGASWKEGPFYDSGRVSRIPSYVREDKALPLVGSVELIVSILEEVRTMQGIIDRLNEVTEKYRPEPERRTQILHSAIQALEAMIADGWVRASYDPSEPLQELEFKSQAIHWNRDTDPS